MTSSKSAPSREAAKKASKEALVKSAMALFPVKGLDVSLDDICAHAGYTRGAFYVHFRNRDELTFEVMGRVGEEWLDSIFEDAREKEGDLIGLMQRFLGELMRGTYPISRNGIRPYQLLDACARSPAIHDRYIEFVRDSIRRLAVYVTNSQMKKQIRPDLDSEQLASIMITVVIGTHTLYDLDYPIDLARTSATLLQLLAVNN
ncbi:TetR/AcrR family transcriptional regulator [uncultured Marinobacter sp.]|uniref:TetR/AcrR family transcriptional regulator n=1 Tax=uncultured Marinobacter sp. TaxID=187379 RepID=UPI00260E36D4|nr:TetR/AcrR family transcriptional regulator [uncultured Marinobacter sp.]